MALRIILFETLHRRPIPLPSHSNWGLCEDVWLNVDTRSSWIPISTARPVGQGRDDAPWLSNHSVNNLPDVFGSRRIAFHGFRSRCASSLAMARVEMQTLMGHVGWKTSSMTRHYLNLNRVVGFEEGGDNLAETPLDFTEHYRKQNGLLGFA